MTARRRTLSLLNKAANYRGRGLRKKFSGLRSKYYRALWQEASATLGATFEDLGDEYYRIAKDEAATIIHRSDVMLDTFVTYKLAGNKPLIYRLYEQLGLTPPPHITFDVGAAHAAQTFLKKQDSLIVVKPAQDTGGGQGVTTGIASNAELQRAIRAASRFGNAILCEKQVTGDNYRLLFLRGQLLDIVRRDPPRLVGDGRSTIKDLVGAENDQRLRQDTPTALSPLVLDFDAEQTLKQQTLSARSVLDRGQDIKFKTVVNQNSAAQNHSVPNTFHPETLAQAKRVISHLKIELAGIDIICADPVAPLSEDNGYIMEVNTAPGLHHHYLTASEGAPNYVAETILNALLQSRSAWAD